MPEPEEKKIIVDEDWKSQVEREKEEAEQQPAPGPHSAELPPANLTTLATTLMTQAFASLGQIPNPVSGKPEVDLGLAKQALEKLPSLMSGSGSRCFTCLGSDPGAGERAKKRVFEAFGASANCGWRSWQQSQRHQPKLPDFLKARCDSAHGRRISQSEIDVVASRGRDHSGRKRAHIPIRPNASMMLPTIDESVG